MNKDIFLKQFPKELEYEINKLYNVFEMAKEYDIISYTEQFYTPNIWKKLNNKIEGVNVITSGIFNDSDRRQVAFVPESFILDEKNKDNKKEGKNDFLQFPNRLLKIEINSKFKQYEHKDFLGSLMGLNIKRELIGDLILENGVAYVPVSEKIKNIILTELNQIGKDSCKIEEIDINKIEKLPEYKYDEKIIVVPSKRLDSIVSAITNLSRTKVVEPIERGKVLVDYYEEKNKSKNLEIGTLITIRGYGKFKLFLDKGETKKGKERLLIKKYI